MLRRRALLLGRGVLDVQIGRGLLLLKLRVLLGRALLPGGQVLGYPVPWRRRLLRIRWCLIVLLVRALLQRPGPGLHHGDLQQLYGNCERWWGWVHVQFDVLFGHMLARQLRQLCGQRECVRRVERR